MDRNFQLAIALEAKKQIDPNYPVDPNYPTLPYHSNGKLSADCFLAEVYRPKLWIFNSISFPSLGHENPPDHMGAGGRRKLSIHNVLREIAQNMSFAYEAKFPHFL